MSKYDTLREVAVLPCLHHDLRVEDERLEANAPSFGLEHARHKGPHCMNEPIDVDAHHPAPIGHCAFPHQTATEHSGVVAKEIHLTELGISGIGKPDDVAFNRNIGAHPSGPGADLPKGRNRFVKTWLFDVRGDHVHPRTGCFLR